MLRDESAVRTVYIASRSKNYPILKFMLPAATAVTSVLYTSTVNPPPPENLLLLLCVLLTRNLFAIAKFLLLVICIFASELSAQTAK